MKSKHTIKTAKKIIRLLEFGLTKGKGELTPGKMCIEAAVTVALGEEFSDKPSCIQQGKGSVNEAKITLNDCNWSSNKARAEGMKYLALAQLGSDIIPLDDFRLLLRLKSTQRILPFLIQKHYEDCKDEKLLGWKAKFESLTILDDKLWSDFCNHYYYNNDDYYYYDYYYYYYNYYNYYYYNEYYYNYYNDYYYNHRYYFGDEFLLLIADVILQTLIELKSPGCKYLKLIK